MSHPLQKSECQLSSRETMILSDSPSFGFDLVNIQPPLSYLDNSVVERDSNLKVQSKLTSSFSYIVIVRQRSSSERYRVICVDLVVPPKNIYMTLEVLAVKWEDIGQLITY